MAARCRAPARVPSGAGSTPTMPSMSRWSRKMRLHAAQVAEFLLADVADEQQVAHGLHLVVVEHLEPRQQHREAARVVRDAGRVELAVALLHLDVGAGRKDRVEVRRDQQLRARCRVPLRRPTTLPSLSIRASVEPQRLHAREEGLGALLFLEGGASISVSSFRSSIERSWSALHRVEQLLDGGRGQELRVGLVDRRLHLRGRRRDGRSLGVNGAGGAQRGEQDGREARWNGMARWHALAALTRWEMEEREEILVTGPQAMQAPPAPRFRRAARAARA